MVSWPTKILLLLALGIGMHSMAADEAGRYASCQSKWKSIAAAAGSDRVTLEQNWKAQRQQCAGTGIFEFRLATLAEINGNRDEAIGILDDALARELPLKDQMRATRLGMLFSKAQFATPKDSAGAKKAHDELEALLVEHPDLEAALHQVAMQRLELEDFSGAAAMSRKGMERNPSAWQPRRTLFLALIANDEYPEARSLIRPTLELHPHLFSDAEYMLAAAHCYLKLGDVQTAEQVLRALRSKVPAVQGDPAFETLARRIVDAKAATKAPP